MSGVGYAVLGASETLGVEWPVLWVVAPTRYLRVAAVIVSEPETLDYPPLEVHARLEHEGLTRQSRLRCDDGAIQLALSGLGLPGEVEGLRDRPGRRYAFRAPWDVVPGATLRLRARIERGHPERVSLLTGILEVDHAH